ncbi:MAG TPA: Asp-tRNA(Asn)/Glu-tRNA(Gln) amidotransferase subunit GatC [Nautiliaceae bacterium]|nr:Asp-tRNA(Asn)/Glu-tRNA(Gln) amidotransferase subunit GatC [Nautiliaceae bacterium]
MKIDENLIKKLESLAMLEVDNKSSMAKDLEEIVEFVENLNEIDTSHIDATFSSLDSRAPLREDKVIKSNIIKEVLKNAPKVKDNFFIVPKIIE